MMHTYQSTRGGPRASLADALFAGLAPDGGLYSPVEATRLGWPPPLGPDFSDTAQWTSRALLGPVIGEATATEIAGSALNFPAPLVEIEDGLHILELFHGPTMAFKDVGARFMASLMATLDPAPAGPTPRTVLVATSGDTGGAVAAAFHGQPGYRVVVLFPADGVSARQRRQMTTLGDNVCAVEVEGTFDDCQRLAKGAFADRGVVARHRLTSANSINIGRLIPQSFYYVHAARLLGWDQAPPRFVVPCGNLGNLFAGLLAHACGMPNRGFLAASNANDTFPHFLKTGTVRSGPSLRTISNAMDVGVPSNLERIRHWFGDDVEAIRGAVTGCSVTDDETRSCITSVHARTGYLLDPHSAVAWHAHSTQRRDVRPTVLLATAHPAKFPDVVRDATGEEMPLPDQLTHAMRAPERVHSMAASPEALADILNRDPS